MKLHFLGPPRIEQAGRAVDFDTRKAPALLAYLAVTGEPQPRETLSTLLWAETDDEHARASLLRTPSARWRSQPDLPPCLGPVSNITCTQVLSRYTSCGI